MAGVRKRLGSLLGPTGRAAKIAAITSEAVPATTPSSVVVGGTDIDRTLHFKLQQGMPAAGAVPQDEGVAGFFASMGSATRAAAASFMGYAFETVTSRDYGVHEAVTPAVRAERIQNLWNHGAATGKTVVMLPGTYVVDNFTGRTRTDGVLTVPAGAHIVFREGCVIERAPFVENTVVTRVIVIGAESTGAKLEGTLKVLGAGTSVAWYNEHNHCVFIYGAKRVDARGLRLIADDAMGDCLSFSGNASNMSEEVWLGSADLRNARRKSLVVETTIGCGIDSVVINNVTGGGAFDYEPLGVVGTGKVASFHLGDLTAYGAIDLTAGSSTAIKLATLTGGAWRIICRNDASPGYFSYGVNLKLQSLYVDARLSAFVGNDTSGHVQVSHTSLFTVGVVEVIVSPTYTGAAVSATTTTSGAPVLDVGSVLVSGAGRLAVTLSCLGRVGSLRIEGSASTDTRIQIGAGALPDGVAAFAASLDIGTIELVNAYNVGHIIGIYAPASTKVRSAFVRKVSVIRTDTRVSAALIQVAQTLTNTQRVYFGELDVPDPTAFTTLVNTSGGGIAFIRHSATPERATYFGTNAAWTPEGVYAAPAGAVVLNLVGGKFFFKKTAGTLNTGWVNLAP